MREHDNSHLMTYAGYTVLKKNHEIYTHKTYFQFLLPFFTVFSAHTHSCTHILITSSLMKACVNKNSSQNKCWDLKASRTRKPVLSLLILLPSADDLITAPLHHVILFNLCLLLSIITSYIAKYFTLRLFMWANIAPRPKLRRVCKTQRSSKWHITFSWIRKWHANGH